MLLRVILRLLSQLFVFLLLSLGFAHTASAASVDCKAVTRNLTIGSQGVDVIALQEILNMDARTKIADSGPGSPGNETDFFGTLTKNAVMRFQELYAKDVLAPVGLAHASGYVGTFSRIKLALLCLQGSNASVSSPQNAVTTLPSPVPPPPATPVTPTPPEAPTQPIAPSLSPIVNLGSVDVDTPLISYPSTYALLAGEQLGIYGAGFTASDNTLHVGTVSFEKLSPDTLGRLNVNIPLSAPIGIHDIWITNAKGMSNKSFVVIKDPNAITPVITSVTPSRGPVGTMINVRGKGFSKSDNEILFSSETLHALSPDGATLQFPASVNIEGFDPAVASSTFSMPQWFYIVNEGGVSNATLYILTK